LLFFLCRTLAVLQQETSSNKFHSIIIPLPRVKALRWLGWNVKEKIELAACCERRRRGKAYMVRGAVDVRRRQSHQRCRTRGKGKLKGSLYSPTAGTILLAQDGCAVRRYCHSDLCGDASAGGTQACERASVRCTRLLAAGTRSVRWMMRLRGGIGEGCC